MSGFLVTGALLEDTEELTASATPVVLTPNSATILKLSGEGDNGSDQVLRLPATSNLQPGVRYYLANRSGVPAEVQDEATNPFATVEPGFEGEFRLLESGVWDASIYPSVRVGTEDLNLSLVCNGQWTWESSSLSVSADAYIHIPGLPNSLNRIAKFPGNAILRYLIPADTASSLAGLYIYVNLPDVLTTTLPEGNVGFYFWLQVGGLGDDPSISQRIGYMVPIDAGSSASDVATALSAAITNNLSEYVQSVVTDDSFTLTYSTAGLVSDPIVSEGFSFDFVEEQRNELGLSQPNAVAYTKVRRSLALASSLPLPVYQSLLDLLDTSDPDLFIIAQNIGVPEESPESGSRVLIGNQLKLIPGQTAELQANSSAKGPTGAIQYNRGDNILTADNNFVWDSTSKILKMGDLYLTSLVGPITLLDNQEEATEIASFDLMTHKNIIIEYSLVRDGNPQVGHMLLVHDGIEASIADNFVATSSLGIQFLASIEDTNLVLAYKSSDTGHSATLRYSMRYWA